MTDQPSAPADTEEVIEQEVPLLVVHQFDVLSAEVAGMDVVSLLMEVDDGEERVVLSFVLPSEDAIRIARSLIGVASTVRPMDVQQRIMSLVEAGEENSSK